jgi:hypothetical protein
MNRTHCKKELRPFSAASFALFIGAGRGGKRLKRFWYPFTWVPGHQLNLPRKLMTRGTEIATSLQ